MGWDNASTVAQEVENPQRNYPLAMVSAAALVAVTYILPLAAVALMGISVANFSTGSWADAAGMIGGPLLATAVVAATGNIYNGLWYPIGVAVMSLVIGTLFLRETKDEKVRLDL